MKKGKNSKNYRTDKKQANRSKNLVGIIKIAPKPIGFLVVDDTDNPDTIIFEEHLNCALDKDEVLVEIIGKDFARGTKRNKGRVVKILNRNKSNFVGTLEKEGDRFVLIPDDFKFYKKIDVQIDSKNSIGDLMESGQKALVELKEWNNPNVNPKGVLLKVLGQKGEHEAEMQSIIFDKGIDYDFPPQVEKEAEEIERINKGKIERLENNRRDFRNITTFTIDPVDAKDFDDALSYEEINESTLRIGVHIADVSHFVRPDTLLDKEARKRSFSTYLVDRTIPMLPEVLSNNLCSLMPNVDRNAFSAVFDIDKKTGKVLDRWFGRTLINSDKRFSYEEAQEMLDLRNTNNEIRFKKELKELDRIAKIYRIENRKNGAIEFETDEVKFELDSKGVPIKIYKKERVDTMKMIEEWMLLANREVAKFISEKVVKKGGVGIFRIHDNPKIDRIEELSIFVRALGYELPVLNGRVDAKDINVLLKKIEGHASESLIKTATIRSMAKAIYSTKNTGHFGLAFEYYTHFTSPIRRYPDLIVHRVLEKALRGEKINKNEFVKFQKITLEASEKEISVQEAERESIKYKQVEYMKNKVGEIFDCTVSGVTDRGIYVEEPKTKSEGMIRLSGIKTDNFVLDQKNYCVIGQNTGRKYSLGDVVKVKLTNADLDRKTLDFEVV
jgi:ribonuclease R